MLIFDGHLDLAWNALQWNRNITQPASVIRNSPQSVVQFDPAQKADGPMQATVSLPDMRRGEVGLCFATLLARSTGKLLPHLDWPTPEQACATARGQLTYYRALATNAELSIIEDVESLTSFELLWDVARPGSLEPQQRKTKSTLSSMLESGKAMDVSELERRLEEKIRQEYEVRTGKTFAGSRSNTRAPGIIIAMEGADPILAPDDLLGWVRAGLRVIGLSHFGPGRYAGGTGTDEGLTKRGITLLGLMKSLGVILDVTHLSDRAFKEVMGRWTGMTLASHMNCRALVPNQRQGSDEQLRWVIERGGVIGAVLDGWMLKPGWERGVTTNAGVTMETVANHIDYVCQLAGNAKHAAIGSDLDGGFGREQSPSDLDTIADLQKLVPILTKRGYKDEDVRGIMHGNWINLLRRAWA